MAFLRTLSKTIKKIRPSTDNFRQIFTEIKYDELLPPTIKCRNVQFLPGSESKIFPEFLSKKANSLFHAIKIEKNKDLTKESTQLLRGYLDDALKEYAAVLIKGLPISETHHFHEFTKQLEFKDMTYASGSGFREQIVSNIYGASDDPAEYTIEPHNEMSVLDKAPSKIMFCCLSEGTTGGESPVVFNQDVMRDINKDVFRKAKDKKIRYYRNLPHKKNSQYITWQGTFLTDKEEKAEAEMKEKNISWKWQENGNLTIWNTIPATRLHPVTGKEIWFNQINANHYTYYKCHPDYTTRQHLTPYEYHYHCSYGDGEEFEESTIDHIRSITWNNAMALKLQNGDVLLLDNFLCQHSRIGYTGHRKVVVQLIQ